MHVLTHSNKNDASYFDFKPSKKEVIRACVDSNMLIMGLRILIGVSSHPVKSVRFLLKSLRISKENARQGFRSWILSLPFMEETFDIVHFEFSGLAIYYRDVISLLEVKRFLVSCRGAEEQTKPYVDKQRISDLTRTFACMDKIHCVSYKLASQIQPYCNDANKIFINHPSIDVSQFRRKLVESTYDYKGISMVSVGRLDWRKGYEYALQAVRLLLEKGHNGLIYRIIGGGPEYEKLIFEVHDLGLASHVEFLGALNKGEVIAQLEKADIYLQSSLTEGLSNATLEAMALELPVVATDVGGTREAITDGLEGFIVSPRNPYELAMKITSLIEDVNLRREMGKKGREKIINQFSLERQTNTYLSIYRELLSVDGN